MKSFSIKELHVSYGKNEVLHGISCEIPANSITAIMGGNAGGKTTLLKSMARLLKPDSGSCFFDDTPLFCMSRKECSRKIAFCSQTHPDCGYLTVSELVSMGRYPYRESDSKSKLAVEKALALAEITEYADKRLDSLSAGTCQRAFTALALAQESELLLLDEPTNFLDPAKHYNLLQLIKKLKQEKNISAVIATHDFELALNIADSVIFLKNGKCISPGCPAENVTAELIFETYGVRGKIISDDSGYKTFIPDIVQQA